MDTNTLEHQPPIADETTADSERPHILIVDDRPDTLEVLTELLESRYIISTILDGEHAVSIAETVRFDLILLDVELPDLNGYDVCQKIKSSALNKNTPVMFVSGCADTEHEIKGLVYGAVDYITKPFSVTSLIYKIENHVRIAGYQRQLETLQGLDPLTGIANRRAFEQRLHSEMQRTQRNDSPLCLIMLDVDYFKSFNDFYGHVDGDACLKKLAGIMMNCRGRSSDIVARYGGEEFAILLPLTDRRGGIRYAKRLYDMVKSQAIPHEDNPTGHVTVSMGLVTYSGKDLLSPHELVEAADAGLYRAKKLGRARLCVASLTQAFH